MTGWRIGYLTGPAPMLEVMAPVQEADGLLRELGHPAGGSRRDPRAAGLRRDDAAGLPAAPRPGGRAAGPDPRRALPRAGRRLLRLPRRAGGDVTTRSASPSGCSSTIAWSCLAGRGVRPALARLPAALLRLLGRGPGRGPDAARGRAGRHAARLTRADREWRTSGGRGRRRPTGSSGETGSPLIRLACGKANALNPRSLDAIERALDEATAGDARGLVLTGYDRFFSAGLDLVALYDLERDAMDAFMAAVRRGHAPGLRLSATGGRRDRRPRGGRRRHPRAGVRCAGDGREPPGASASTRSGSACRFPPRRSRSRVRDAGARRSSARSTEGELLDPRTPSRVDS